MNMDPPQSSKRSALTHADPRPRPAKRRVSCRTPYAPRSPGRIQSPGPVIRQLMCDIGPPPDARHPRPLSTRHVPCFSRAESGHNAWVDTTARDTAVDALIAMSLSPDYRDRADAGVALASLADSPRASERLYQLVLDPDNTATTRLTVEALTRRGDSKALTVIAAALASADIGRQEWIATGVNDALGWADWDWAERIAVCETLPDAEQSSRLRALLLELRPQG